MLQVATKEVVEVDETIKLKKQHPVFQRDFAEQTGSGAVIVVWSFLICCS
jgi:hypothetical protein